MVIGRQPLSGLLGSHLRRTPDKWRPWPQTKLEAYCLRLTEGGQTLRRRGCLGSISSGQVVVQGVEAHAEDQPPPESALEIEILPGKRPAGQDRER